MGGFKILFTDIDKFQWRCKEEMEDLISACEKTIKDIEHFNELPSFTGQSATAIKTYLLQVHGAIVKAIQIIAQEFLDQTIKYKYGYLSINEAAYYTLPQDTIQACKDRYSSALTAVQMETTRIKNSIQNIRDIYYVATPSVSSVESEHKAIDTKLKDFIEKISNHETKDTPTNLEMLTVLLSSLRKSLAECSSRNPSQISSYSSGDFFKVECNAELAYYADLCYTYHEQIKDDLNKVWDYEIELHDKLEEGRKTQGAWQIIGGVCLVVAGVVCIVATAGAATPIVAAGAVAGGGTIAFGAAEMYEGGENIYLGSSGDISSTAFNPIRDTAFQGNQEAYDFTKGAFAFTASALTPIGAASTAGNLTVRSGTYIVGEVVVSDAAGGLASKGTAELCEQWGFDPNVTRAVSMVSGMVASGATSKGLTKLDAKFNISGMYNSVKPKAFQQEEFNSSYEERIRQTPGDNNELVEFKNKELRGESKCTLKPPPDPELKKILDDAGIDGIEYKNAVPDFTPVSKLELEGIDMSKGRLGTNGTYSQANNQFANMLNESPELAKQFGISPKNGKTFTASDVKSYMKNNGLTWHELNDLTTVQMVPTKINSAFGHLGGISEAVK